MTRRNIFVGLLAAVIFAPSIQGRDYVGIVLVFLCFLSFIASGKRFGALSKIISAYYLYTLIAEILISYTIGNPGVVYFLNSSVYILIIPISFMVGHAMGCHNHELADVDLGVVFIAGLEALSGILQEFSSGFREISLTMYSRYENVITSFADWNRGRAVGTVGNPNYFGILMVIFILYIIFKVIANPRHSVKFRGIGFIVTICCLAALFYSQSRTAIVCLAVGGVVGVMCLKVSLKLKLKFGVAFGTLLLVGLLVMGGDLLHRSGPTEDLLSVGSRGEIWDYFISLYLSQPAVSILFGRSNFAFQEGFDAFDNNYLNILISYGVIGLFLYGYLLYQMLRKFLQIRDPLNFRFCIALCISVCVADVTGNFSIHIKVGIIYYLLLGYCLPSRLTRPAFQDHLRS